MAWRPTRFLIEGMFDNTSPKKVTGWMKFVGVKRKVTFDLEGDFHRDIRGAKIRFTGDAEGDIKEAREYMKGFAQHQTGTAGDMTAGLPPQDYVDYCYLEWFGKENGRVVIELEQDKVKLLSKPMPACEIEPISRDEQAHNMAEFLAGLAKAVNIPPENTFCIGGNTVIKGSKRAANNKIRGMKLLTKEIRKILPPLYSQESKGGKAIAHVKFFTPSSNWTWWATEGSPIKDKEGNEVDFHFFGLVDGHFKELGYFSLKELEGVQGPLGLPIERDLYWQPKTLEEIAPELFGKTETKGGKHKKEVEK